MSIVLCVFCCASRAVFLRACRVDSARRVVWCAAERVPGERAVRGGLVPDDGGVLLGVPQAGGHRPTEAAALHHEPQQV